MRTYTYAPCTKLLCMLARTILKRWYSETACMSVAFCKSKQFPAWAMSATPSLHLSASAAVSAACASLASFCTRTSYSAASASNRAVRCRALSSGAASARRKERRSLAGRREGLGWLLIPAFIPKCEAVGADVGADVGYGEQCVLSGSARGNPSVIISRS